MKTRIFFSLLAVTGTILVLAACSKKEDDNQGRTKTALIVQSTWKFSTATVSGMDVAPWLQSCQKDNTVSFQANGNGTLDEGDTKCNTGDPQSHPFTWSFTGNESALHVSTILFTGGSNDFTVISLSASQLVVSQNITVSGTSQTAVVTFVH